MFVLLAADWFIKGKIKKTDELFEPSESLEVLEALEALETFESSEIDEL